MTKEEFKSSFSAWHQPFCNGVEKTDVLDKIPPTDRAQTLPIYHAGHWYYESKKGKISLAHLAGKYAYPDPYEIFSWDKLFEDIERFHSMTEAENRIIEILGDTPEQPNETVI